MASSQAPEGYNVCYNLQKCNQFLSPYTDRIQIKNLCVEAIVGHNIFGEKKMQPVQISVVVPLPNSIGAAAEEDVVNRSTIHYGLLSKAIRHHVQERASEPMTVAQFAYSVGWAIKYTISKDRDYPQPFKVVVSLPKASAWGTGIRYHFLFNRSQMEGQTLHLENLRVHTIIGVNPPERKTRQPVVVNVWIDPLNSLFSESDCYNEVELIVVKTIEESSFQTLEALSEAIVSNLFKLLVFQVSPESAVRVHIEKPLAVLMAEAPAVEIERSAKPDNQFARAAWDECGRKNLRRIPMPFPLEEELGSYLKP